MFKQKTKPILPSDIQTIGIIPRAEYSPEDLKRRIIFKAVGTHPGVRNAIFRFTARTYNAFTDGSLLREDTPSLLPSLSTRREIVREIIDSYERRSENRALLQILFPLPSDDLSETRIQPPTHVLEWAFQAFNPKLGKWQHPPTIVFLFPVCFSFGGVVPNAICINVCSRIFERIELLTEHDRNCLTELIQPCDETTITWIGYLLIFARAEYDRIKAEKK